MLNGRIRGGAVRRTRRTGSLVLAVTTAMLFSGCSLILNFDEEEKPGDVDAAVSDAAPLVDGGDSCAAFESNDELAAAVLITPGTHGPLGICPGGDLDFFRFDLGDNEDMVVEATFENLGGAGDLEMRLYDQATGMVVDGSMGVLNFERIERSLANADQLPAGTYIVEIYGFNGTTENPNYSLSLTISTP